MIHSKEDYDKAVEASKALFDKDINSIVKLDKQTFNDVFEGVKTFKISKYELNNIDIAELLAVKTDILSSKSAVRKAIQNNAISINKVKVTDINHIITNEDIMDNRFIFVQNGKKNMFLILI